MYQRELSYIALDFDLEMDRACSANEVERKCTLPDGEEATLNKILFQPHTGNLDYDPIQSAILDSITKCPENIQRKLFGNIIFSGGTTMRRGLDVRIYGNCR